MLERASLGLWTRALDAGLRLGLVSPETHDAALQRLGGVDPPPFGAAEVAAWLGLKPTTIESLLQIASDDDPARDHCDGRERKDETQAVEPPPPVRPPEAGPVDMPARCTAATLIESEAAIPVEPGRPAMPERLGSYRLIRELGRGAQGAVYLARHEKLGTECAVKVSFLRAREDEAFLTRFRREAAAVSRMGKHPNIVGVHDYGEAGQSVYYAMELVKGESLADVLEKRTLSPTEAAVLLEKVAKAVHFAHEKGVIHRDLKPANIVLRDDGEPQVADFGLARETAIPEALVSVEGAATEAAITRIDGTREGAMLGTPAYMAPEQAVSAREVDARADLYALGAILYHMLTGRPPHTGDSLGALLMRKLRGEVTPLGEVNREVPAGLEAICLKCLALRLEDRYASCDELADDLGRWRSVAPVRATGWKVGERFGRYRWTGNGRLSLGTMQQPVHTAGQTCCIACQS